MANKKWNGVACIGSLCNGLHGFLCKELWWCMLKCKRTIRLTPQRLDWQKKNEAETFVVGSELLEVKQRRRCLKVSCELQMARFLRFSPLARRTSSTLVVSRFRWQSEVIGAGSQDKHPPLTAWNRCLLEATLADGDVDMETSGISFRMMIEKHNF